MSYKPTKIAVVASFMTDMVINAPRRPMTGETIIGNSFEVFLGGKGFNQALAASRLGSTVTLIGNLGDDEFADRFTRMIDLSGIDGKWVTRDGSAKTGIASVVIDKNGDNSIIIVPGANMQLSPLLVEKAHEAITKSDLLLLQQEVPAESLTEAAELAHKAGVPVMLNPAPARGLDSHFLSLVDIIAPNETEAAFLTGSEVSDLSKAAEAAKLLFQQGIKIVVITLGSRGAIVKTADSCFHVPGYEVQVVDTTAAGDAFCAALAYMYSQKASMEECVRFANAVGAMATMVRGAEPALPRKSAVEQFIQSHPPLKINYLD